RRQAHHAPTAGQARRPTRDRDHPRRRLPHRIVMTSQQLARRSLQTRLALAYATGIYAAGAVVLVLVVVPLAGVQSATPKGQPSSGDITGTGNGISLPQILTGSAVALVVLIPVALAL